MSSRRKHKSLLYADQRPIIIAGHAVDNKQNSIIDHERSGGTYGADAIVMQPACRQFRLDRSDFPTETKKVPIELPGLTPLPLP